MVGKVIIVVDAYDQQFEVRFADQWQDRLKDEAFDRCSSNVLAKDLVRANDGASGVWIGKFHDINIVVGMFPKFLCVCIVVRKFPYLIRDYVNSALFRIIMVQLQFCHATIQYHSYTSVQQLSRYTSRSLYL